MPPCRRGRESSGGSAGQHLRRRSRAGRPRRLSRQGRRRPAGRGVPPRHQRDRACTFPTAPLTGGAPTARCLILVTPDGQRTMNTYLGACVTFGEDDVDEALVAAARGDLPGRLSVRPAGGAGGVPQGGRRGHAPADRSRCRCRMRSASTATARHSATWCADHVDILFANETEITSLYEKNTFEEAAEPPAPRWRSRLLTRSRGRQRHLARCGDRGDRRRAGEGCRYHRRGRCLCGGFPAGWTPGRPLPACGRMGSIAAAEVISHYGARPEADLQALVARALG